MFGSAGDRRSRDGICRKVLKRPSRESEGAPRTSSFLPPRQPHQPATFSTAMSSSILKPSMTPREIVLQAFNLGMGSPSSSDSARMRAEILGQVIVSLFARIAPWSLTLCVPGWLLGSHRGFPGGVR